MAKAKYATEAELCADFIAWAQPQGWTAYPETEGWDVLMVAPSGHQLGVQAKLKLNAKVLAQAAPGPSAFSQWGRDRGPDFRALLVPERSELASIATMLGFAVITPGYQGFACETGLYGVSYYGAPMKEWAMTDWNPATRERLPDYVPDVPAGVPGPRSLSRWKVGALRVMATLELRGEVTRKEVEALGLNSRRWCAADGWLKPGSAPGQWRRGDGCPDFAAEHPEVYPKVLEEVRAKLAAEHAKGAGNGQ